MAEAKPVLVLGRYWAFHSWYLRSPRICFSIGLFWARNWIASIWAGVSCAMDQTWFGFSRASIPNRNYFRSMGKRCLLFALTNVSLRYSTFKCPSLEWASLFQLLTDLGKHHPQALVYPLTVASKSSNAARKNAANKILNKIREHSETLVNQVSSGYSVIAVGRSN